MDSKTLKQAEDLQKRAESKLEQACTQWYVQWGYAVSSEEKLRCASNVAKVVAAMGYSPVAVSRVSLWAEKYGEWANKEIR